MEKTLIQSTYKVSYFRFGIKVSVLQSVNERYALIGTFFVFSAQWVLKYIILMGLKPPKGELLMIKMIATDAMVSPGFQGQPTIWTSENGNACQFRIGCRVFDPKAENGSRWINISVKAFGKLAEKVGKMKVKEKSVLTISGRLDEESWTKDNVEQKRFILVADDIEFTYGNNAENKAASNAPVPETPAGAGQQYGAPPNGNYGANGYAPAPSAPVPNPQGGFTGYENFGGENPFFGG